MVSISISLTRTHESSSAHKIHPRGSSPRLTMGEHHDSVHMKSSLLFWHQVLFESYHKYDLSITNTGPIRQSSAHRQLQTWRLGQPASIPHTLCGRSLCFARPQHLYMLLRHQKKQVLQGLFRFTSTAFELTLCSTKKSVPHQEQAQCVFLYSERP